MQTVGHVAGKDLRALEGEVEALTVPVKVVSVNNVNGNWFIHFVMVDEKPIITSSSTEAESAPKARKGRK